MSVVSTCAITAYSVEVVRIAPASSARPRSIVRRTKSQVIATPASAASAGVRRAANSLTPEQRHPERAEPIEQRRLLDVGDVVQVRHDEVARGQHLARDLGVARLVGLPQAVAAEMEEEDRGRERQQRERLDRGRAPGARPAPRRAAAAGGAELRGCDRRGIGHDAQVYRARRLAQLCASAAARSRATGRRRRRPCAGRKRHSDRPAQS